MCIRDRFYIPKWSPNNFIFPNNEKTIEQNRLWRLYSNNFRQNSQSNNSNIMTQLSLLDTKQF